MSVVRPSPLLWLCIASFAAAPVSAQGTGPALATPTPAATAADSGEPAAAPPAASDQAAGPASVDANPARASEPPPPSNPYPVNRGSQPRRWTNDDMARVRRMLEAERARRGQLAGQKRITPQPAAVPEAPVQHGDAGAAIGLGLSIDAIFHDDIGFRLFDQSKASTRLGIWASHDLASLSQLAILSGELGFGVEANDGDAVYNSASLPMHLQTTTFHGALSVRWKLCSFFAPHVRAAGGLSVVHLEVDGIPNLPSIDNAVSGFGALGAGFMLHTPPRLFENRKGNLASLTFGVMFEVGYALRSSVKFALASPNSARDISVVNAGLGQLDLSGAYVRTSLVTRF